MYKFYEIFYYCFRLSSHSFLFSFHALSFPLSESDLSLSFQDSVDAIRREMPSKNFSDMIAVLRKFVSFMNIAVSLYE